MVTCSIRGCESHSKNRKGNLSLFSFPKRPDLLEKWISNIGADNIKPVKWLTVCSKHFEENGINRTLGVIRLKDNVVPTLFLARSKRHLSYKNPDEYNHTTVQQPEMPENTSVCNPPIATNSLAVVNEDPTNIKQEPSTETATCSDPLQIDTTLETSQHSRKWQPKNKSVNKQVAIDPAYEKYLDRTRYVMVTQDAAQQIQILSERAKTKTVMNRALQQKIRRLQLKVDEYQHIIDDLQIQTLQKDIIELEERAPSPEYICVYKRSRI